MYCIAYEIRENYTNYITIFEGDMIAGKAALGNGKFSIDYSFRIKREILDVKIKQLNDSIKKYLNEEGFIGYDGHKVHHGLNEISELDVKEIMDIISNHEDNDELKETIEKVSVSKDIHEYMFYFNHSLKMIETFTGGKDKYYKMLEKEILVYKNKQITLAKQDGEKKLIYFEMSLPTEDKGSYVKKEYVLPDGTTEKFEGWEYNN